MRGATFKSRAISGAGERENEMKATRLVKQQHDKTRKLFAQLQRAKEDRRAEIMTELADGLAAHMMIEEQIFYPAARQVVEDLVLMDAALLEHDGAKMSLRRMLTDEQMLFEAKVKVLRDLVEHHASQEEEMLLPMLEEAMEEAELKDLGLRMKTAYEEAIAAGHMKVLAMPTPPPTTGEAEVQVEVQPEAEAEEEVQAKPAARKKSSQSRANGRAQSGNRSHARA